VLRKLCTGLFDFSIVFSDFFIFLVIISKEVVRDFFEYFTPRLYFFIPDKHIPQLEKYPLSDSKIEQNFFLCFYQLPSIFL